MKRYYGSWIVFILLGGLMGFLRYGNILGEEPLSFLRTYGPWFILLIYAILILTAFKDSMYQGILSLLIPLYPLYYLFMVSDLFYVRAVVAGLLVGLGQDSAAFFQETMVRVIDNVQNWIESGG